MMEDPKPPSTGWGLHDRARQGGAFLVIVAAGFSCYRAITNESVWLQESAIFILGLPVGLALFLLMLPTNPDRTAGTSAIIGTSLIFLLGIIALPEGFICWLMASPIFLLVAIIAGAANTHDDGPHLRAVLFLPLAILSIEGALVGDFVSPVGSATSSQVVALSADDVETRLAAPPEFGEINGFLGLGFPTPTSASGSGLELGDERIIMFTGGTAERPSLMHLQVAEAEDGRVVFAILNDTTPIANWLDLNQAVITWTDDGDSTTVNWTLNWDRKLRPGIYFGPLQDFGMGKAASYLLDSTVG